MKKRKCPKCGKEWTDFELMTKGGIVAGDNGDIKNLQCPSCKADLGHF